MIANSSAETTEEPTLFYRGLAILKLLAASAVVITLITVIIIGVIDKYCILQLPPALNFFILLCCVTLLAYVEGNLTNLYAA